MPRDLRELADIAGTERARQFVELASSYLQRLRDADWTLTLGEWSGLGPLSVGQHSGVAIGEWHVHAWDIAKSIGEEHRLRDAAVVAEGNRVIRDDPNTAIPGWRSLRHTDVI